MTGSNFSITVFWDTIRGLEVTRANYFGKKGSSTQTCYSYHEAQLAINKFRRKDELKGPE